MEVFNLAEKLEKERKKNKELEEKIDKAELKLLRDIEYLKDQKRRLMEIITPETGYLKAELEYKIEEKEELLDILKGE